MQQGGLSGPEKDLVFFFFFFPVHQDASLSSFSWHLEYLNPNYLQLQQKENKCLYSLMI